MSSIFKPRRGEEGGSGGKVLQQRRHSARAPSPYQRPQPPPPQARSPNWIFRASRAIANGAGKLASSIFGSNNSDSDVDSSSEEDDDDISPELDESKQIVSTPYTNKNQAHGLEPFTHKSEVKLAIEQLLRQETFSRDECNHLTEILKSRVVDRPPRKEGEDTAQNGIACREENRPPGPGRKSPGISPRWESSLKSVALGSPATQTPRHDICNEAVMEAKKWVEEKKLESSSSSGREHGIKTSALLPVTVTEGTDYSPADMAKSYMQLRPPWASPSLNYTGLRTPPPIRAHVNRDEGPYTISSNMPSSSKVLKRSSLATGTENSVDEIRKVRLKSTQDILATPMFKQIDSSARMLEHGICQTPSATDDKLVGADKSVDRSVKLPAELAVNDGSPDGTLSWPCEKSIEEHLPVELLNAEPKITMLSEINHGFSSDIVAVAITNNTLTFSKETSARVEEPVIAKSSAQPQQLSGLKEVHTTIDPRRQSGNNQLEQKGNVLTNGVTANGCASSPSSSAAGADPGLGPSSERPRNVFTSSNITEAVDNTFESCALSEAVNEIPIADEAYSVEDGSKNDSSAKDNPLQSGQSEPSRNAAEKRGQGVGTRGRKVSSSQRGRGRGKGRGRWK